MQREQVVKELVKERCGNTHRIHTVVIGKKERLNRMKRNRNIRDIGGNTHRMHNCAIGKKRPFPGRANIRVHVYSPLKGGMKHAHIYCPASAMQRSTTQGKPVDKGTLPVV